MAAVHRTMTTIAVSLIAIATLNGCGNSGPTAVQAAQTLRADTNNVIRYIDAQNVAVAEDGSKPVPCGKDKAKYRYSATGTRKVLGENQFGRVDLMIAPLARSYTVTHKEIKKVPVGLRNDKARVSLWLDAPTYVGVSISGETDCLRTS